MQKRGKRIVSIIQLFLIISLSFVTSISLNSQSVEAGQVCCEKTKGPNVRYCDYVDENECAPGSQSVPTSCDQTSFCKTGCCAGIGGYCYENYPKALCEQQYNGRYNVGDCSNVNECKKGCCVIGTQAAYTTKNKCIAETEKYPDLEVDFRENINSEQECVDVARSSEKGCCVNEDSDGGNMCRYTSKADCAVSGNVNGTTGFKSGKYCSELPNSCSCAPGDPSIRIGGNIAGQGNPKSTTCISTDDSVYWKDSCGNPEGVKQKCDYASGTICGDSDKDGKYTCETVDCKGQTGNSENVLSVDQSDTSGKISKEIVGKDVIKNGESWCLWDYPSDDARDSYFGKDPVGSRHYRSICINGKELIEPCSDFRKEYCFSSDIPLEGAKQNTEFLAARCLKNDRAESCVNECNTADPVKMPQQEYSKALENDYGCCTDISKRDCQWAGKCVPAVKPGYKFWENEGTDQCGKANLECKATFVCPGWDSKLGICNTEGGDTGWRWAKRVGVTGLAAVIGGISSGGLGAVGALVAVGGMLSFTEVGQGGWTLANGGECFSKDFVQASNNYCRSLGDCGADINYQGKLSVDGYSITNTELDSELIAALKDLGSEKIAERTEQVRDKLDVPFSDQDQENLKKELEYIDELTEDQIEFGNVSLPPKFDNPRLNKGKVEFTPDWDAGKTFLSFSLQQTDFRNFGNRMFRRDNWLVGFLGLGIISGGTSLLAGFTAGSVAVGFSALIKTTPLVNALGLGASFANTKAETFIGKAVDPANYGTLSKEAAEKSVSGVAKTYEDKIIRKALVEDAYKKLNVPSGSEVKVFSNPSRNLWEVEIKNKKLVRYNHNEALDIAGGRDAIQKAKEEAIQKLTTSNTANFVSGLGVGMWVFTAYKILDTILEDTKEVTVKSSCSSWQAPPVTQSDQCEQCNADSYKDEKGNPTSINAFKKCSEYRCKSLGASCELINKGTDKELCVSLFKYDVNPPVINPWKEGTTPELQNRISAQGFQQPGFGITGEIPIYERFNIALKTDKPTQCKMSFNHGKRFEEMDNFYFGGNVYDYFHIQQMFYPATKNATESLTLTGGGSYKLYVRCQDALGNVNLNDYIITFNIENATDITPPQISGTSIGEETYVTYSVNKTKLNLYVNEPGECRYATQNIDYLQMLEINSCFTQGVNNLGFYECKFTGEPGAGPAITGIESSAGKVKYVYFKCKDRNENYNKEAFRVTIRGSNPLVIDSIKTDPLPDENGEIKISKIIPITLKVSTSQGAKTDGSATCSYLLNPQGSNVNSIAGMTLFSNTNGSLHEQIFSGPQGEGSLSTGEHKFYVGCTDVAGNTAFTNTTIKLNPDVNAPMILRTYLDNSLQPPTLKVEINEEATCKDSLTIFDYEKEGNEMSKEGNVHTTTTPGNNFYYVICKDNFGNLNTQPIIVQIA